VIDTAVNVALLGLSDSALEPRTGGAKLPGARQAIAHQVQACTEALVINTAMNVALLFFRDGALEPRTGGAELPVARQTVAHVVQA
jgi:hypothetical protein